MLTALRLVMQAVHINGTTYDVCVRLCGTDRVLVLAKNFEDVRAPRLLRQAAEAQAGCPGYLEDEEQGLFWSSIYPLNKKDRYIFCPYVQKEVSP